MVERHEVNVESEKLEANDFTEVVEGKAKILFPKSNSVFYNNVQVFNRDLSIAVIKQFFKIRDNELKELVKKTSESRSTEIKHTEAKTKIEETDNLDKVKKIVLEENISTSNSDIPVAIEKKSYTILEALSATGLRSVRYALEIPNIKKIIANDLSHEAEKTIRRNIAYNKVDAVVQSSLSDASLLMYQHRFPLSSRFQVIDLDPFGSPSQFLDGAVQAIDEGGLLCVTCTDMAGLCGNHGEAAYAKYGCMPLKSKYCHEMALRIVLSCIDSHANRYKRYIEPLLSLSVDFYLRIFVRVFSSPSEVKRSASKRSYVFHCSGCETFHLQPVGKSVEIGNSKKYNPATGPVVSQLCDECNHIFKIGGPIWSKSIHSETFVTALLVDIEKEKDCYSTQQRIRGTLSVVLEELPDHPLYLVIDHLCNVLHSTTPSHAQFRSAVIHAGYEISSTHANQAGLKTSAPVSVIWDILRSWVKLHPVNQKKISSNSPASVILSKESKRTANFEIIQTAVPQSKMMKLLRYPENPEADWGPKSKAIKKEFSSLSEKRQTLQGKRKAGFSDPAFYRQFPCKRFKIGICDLGINCKYSHESSTNPTDQSNSTKNASIFILHKIS
ncbi:tRNA (guanine(26)-N(2))-dimethyltransferase isoform X2 [Hydra vulgaris]|uniref:tRNA (guanine(26)-N(2))-dimethyltransferase n=1 Tax=Hydra vulgaris TaxID=6087 RepID=A0ABM4BGH4_HYDVU